MLNFPLYWWYIPIILFAIPFVYERFRKRGGRLDIDILGIAIYMGCWMSAFTLCLTVFAVWVLK